MTKGDLLLWAGVIGAGAVALLVDDDASASAATPNVAATSLPVSPRSNQLAIPAPKATDGAAVVQAPPSIGSPADRDAKPGAPPVVIGDDVEALARIITSEVGRGPMPERVAIAWVARNRARQKGMSIAAMVCNPCGKSSGSQRPFSSARRAMPVNRELAALVLAALPSEDPTMGAIGCFEPSLQDRLHADGRQGHGLDARGVRYCWLRKLDYYGSVGRWDLFGPKGGAGARPAPTAWGLAGFAVCCSRDKRPECRGQFGKVLTQPEREERRS